MTTLFRPGTPQSQTFRLLCKYTKILEETNKILVFILLFSNCITYG